MGSSAKKVGLFVGFGKYTESNAFAALPGAPRDANNMDAFFTRLGFSTDFFTHEHIPSHGVREHVRRAVAQLGEGDIFVFFFAGHGHTNERINSDGTIDPEQYILLPTASASDVAGGTFSDGTLGVKAIASASYRPGLQRLFILDCCRGGKKRTNEVNRDGELDDTAQVFKGEGAFRSIVGSYTTDTVQPAPLAIYASCQDGSLAKELPGNKGGLFSNCWLKVSEEQHKAGQQIVLSRSHQDEVGKLMLEMANDAQIATGGYKQMPHYEGKDIHLWSPPEIIETVASKKDRLRNEFTTHLYVFEFDEPLGACARDVLGKLSVLGISVTEKRELTEQLQEARQARRIEEEAKADEVLISKAEYDGTGLVWSDLRFTLKLPANRELAKCKVNEFKQAAKAKIASEKLNESSSLAELDKFLLDFKGSAYAEQAQTWRDEVEAKAKIATAALTKEQAALELEEAAFSALITNSTQGQCDSFLHVYPHSKRKDTVLQIAANLVLAADNAAYKRAKTERTLGSCNSYLRQFLNGQHFQRVEALKLEIKAEEEAKADDVLISKAEQENTELSWSSLRFTLKLPANRELAERKVNEFKQAAKARNAFEKLNESSDLAEFDKFLNEFGGTAYVKQVQDWRNKAVANAKNLAENQLFSALQKNPTLQSCSQFLLAYPQSLHRTVVLKIEHKLKSDAEQTKAEDKAFDKTRSIRTVAVCDAYLDQYSNGRYKSTVLELKNALRRAENEQLENEAFERVKQQRSIELCNWFLRQYENSQHRPLVKQLLRGLVEDADFARCKSANTIAPFKDFLKQHPNSRYKTTVQQLQSDLQKAIDEQNELNEFNRVENAGSAVACTWFLDNYPKSIHSTAVQQILANINAQREQEDFVICKDKNTVVAFDAFLTAYPNGRYVATVQDLKSKLKKPDLLATAYRFWNRYRSLSLSDHVSSSLTLGGVALLIPCLIILCADIFFGFDIPLPSWLPLNLPTPASGNWYLTALAFFQGVVLGAVALGISVIGGVFLFLVFGDKSALRGVLRFDLSTTASRMWNQHKPIWVGNLVILLAVGTITALLYYNPTLSSSLRSTKSNEPVTAAASPPPAANTAPPATAAPQPKTTYVQYLTLRAPVVSSDWWQKGTGVVPAGAQAMIDAAAELASDSANPLAQIDLADFYHIRSATPDQAKAVELYARWYANPSNTSVSTSDKQLLVRNVANNLSTALRVGIARPPGELDWRGASTAIMALKAYPAQFWQARVIKCLLPTDANTLPRVKAVLQAAAAADGPQFLTDDYRSLAKGQLDPVALNRTCRDADENAPTK